MVSSAKVHNYFEIIHFFIVLLRQIWHGLPYLPHFFAFCCQALMNATLRRTCWKTTIFWFTDPFCRSNPTLSQQLREDFALIFGIWAESPYLCRRKQVATASEGCGSAKLEQVRLCVRLALHLHRQSDKTSSGRRKQEN